jgi:peroxiredoxin
MNDRVTFVIDRDGIVRNHSTGVLASDPHVQESLKVVLSL